MIGDYQYRVEIEKPRQQKRKQGRMLLAASAVGIIAIGLAMGLAEREAPLPHATASVAPATPDIPSAEPEAIEESTALAIPLPLPDDPTKTEPEPEQPIAAETAEPEPAAAAAPALEPVTIDATQTKPVVTATDEPRRVTAEAPEAPPSSEPEAEPHAITHKVESGDTLAEIFSDLGLSANLLYNIVNSDPEAKRLANIKPGQTLRLELDQKGEFSQLTYEIDAVSSLQISSDDEGFSSRLLSKQVERRDAHTTGIIASSLFADGRKAGLSDSKIMEMAELFGWDIDFSLELRSGDSFTLVYEEEYLDDVKFRDGPILAAEFVNQGKTYRAVRYEDPSGHVDYYSPDGQSMRKAFLRSPIQFARISSRFSTARKHPVLGKIRAHKGVDYAAPTGTPIRSAGDGVISFRGKKGGYGKTVIVDHGNGKSTLYAHMSRFAPGKQRGNRIKQGQVVGYVGSTGLATGPHLHYEFRVDGVHRNPLTVKLPLAKPIEKKYREDFMRKTQPLMAQLDSLGRTLVADAR